MQEGRTKILRGVREAKREEVLNFIDFFASFLGQAKNEEPVRLEDKILIRLRCFQKYLKFKLEIVY